MSHRHTKSLTLSKQSGLTLIEVLIVIVIIGLVVALILPAVQSARESARQVQCKNNLRNLALASQLFENSFGYLPGPVLNAHPTSGKYVNDTGLFVSILPFIEQQALYDRFDHSDTTFSSRNQAPLLTPPSMLKCPTASEPMQLIDIAERFSGPPSAVNSVACDYMGNGGCFFNDKLKLGSVRLRVGEIVKQQRLKNIRDGLSNTLLFWESRGDALFSENGSRGTPDSVGLTFFRFVLDGSSNSTILSTTIASYKSYVLSWAGFRMGSVQARNGLESIKSNIVGEPLSSHPNLICTVKVDGSVEFLSTSMDSSVLAALATVEGNEVISME